MPTNDAPPESVLIHARELLNAAADAEEGLVRAHAAWAAVRTMGNLRILHAAVTHFGSALRACLDFVDGLNANPTKQRHHDAPAARQ
jgi:hypothetical protein